MPLKLILNNANDNDSERKAVFWSYEITSLVASLRFLSSKWGWFVNNRPVQHFTPPNNCIEPAKDAFLAVLILLKTYNENWIKKLSSKISIYVYLIHSISSTVSGS